MFHGFDIFKATSVNDLYKHFFRTLYNNVSKLIQIEGMEEYVDNDFVMSQLILSGRIAIFKNGQNMVWLNANVGGDVNEYYKPQKILISNPILGSKELKRDTNAVVIHLTPMDILQEYPKTHPFFQLEGGLYSLISMCANLLADNISSINTAQINTRVHAVFTADNNSAAQSAETILKRIYEGKPYSVVTSEMLSEFHVNPMSSNGISKDLIELLEVCQYIISIFWNSIGIDANYNMKRESINSNESQLNDDMLHPLIDDMLARRREALEEVNKMFGTNITVDFNGAWLTNEKEGELTLDQMETATDSMEETAPDQTEEEFIEEDDTPEDNVEFEEDADTPEEVIPKEETAPEETDTAEVVKAIEDAAEVIADAIEGDTPEEDNKEGDE